MLYCVSVSYTHLVIQCNRAYPIDGMTFNCMYYHGPTRLNRALTVSCNVFFYDVGRMLGIQKMNEYSTLYGLGQKTGIEVGESTGVLAGPSYRESLGLVWNPGDTCSAAIGQSDNALDVYKRQAVRSAGGTGLPSL